jgi:hypothetical protein
MAEDTCEHEWGALGAASGDFCIHCGAKMKEVCPFDGMRACWDAQDERMDPNFSCPVHGQAQDTLERLGVDVL